VLRAVRTTTLDAYSHQLYPFDRVVEDLELKRVPGRNPLFDVGFTLQNQHEVQASPASRHLRMSEMARDSAVVADAEATTDLWFIARNDDGNLAVQVVYNGARFSAARVDQLSQDLLKIVSAAGVDPDMTVKALPLTTSGGPNAGRTITIDLGF
jgi:non-ribosomal peptide synthetase component F